MPQAPQLPASEVKSLQTPLQLAPDLHVHLPLTHDCPLPQAFPQAPQSPISTERSLQWPLQYVW
jgi:hypothetical protein